MLKEKQKINNLQKKLEIRAGIDPWVPEVPRLLNGRGGNQATNISQKRKKIELAL